MAIDSICVSARPVSGIFRTSSAAAFMLAAFAFAEPLRAQSPRPSATAEPVVGVATEVAPGDDFDGYANGAWARTAPVVPSASHWGARNEINELTRKDVDETMKRAGQLPPGSAGRKAADYVRAYSDEAALERHGLAGLRALLARIDGLRSKTDLSRLLGAEMLADADPVNAGVYDSSTLLGSGEARYGVERGATQ